MTMEPIKHAAESAVLLLAARMAQVILVPILVGMLSWTFVSITGLQVDVARAVSTSEANNRMLIKITGDIEARVFRLEDRQRGGEK